MSVCGNKKIYYTKTQALKHAKKEAFRLKHRMFIYSCKECKYYHLTSHKNPLRMFEIKSAKIKFLAE